MVTWRRRNLDDTSMTRPILRASWWEVLRGPDNWLHGVPTNNVWSEPGREEARNGPQGRVILQNVMPVPNAKHSPRQGVDQKGNNAHCGESEWHVCTGPSVASVLIFLIWRVVRWLYKIASLWGGNTRMSTASSQKVWKEPNENGDRYAERVSGAYVANVNNWEIWVKR